MHSALPSEVTKKYTTPAKKIKMANSALTKSDKNSFRAFHFPCVLLGDDTQLISMEGANYEGPDDLDDAIVAEELEELERTKTIIDQHNNNNAAPWFPEFEARLRSDDKVLMKLLCYGMCHAFQNYDLRDGYNVSDCLTTHNVPQHCVRIPTMEEILSSPALFDDDYRRVDVRTMIMTFRVFHLFQCLGQQRVAQVLSSRNFKMGDVEVEVSLSYDCNALLWQQDDFLDCTAEEVEQLLRSSGYDVTKINTCKGPHDYYGDVVAWKQWSLQFTGCDNGECDRSIVILQGCTEDDVAILRQRRQ